MGEEELDLLTLETYPKAADGHGQASFFLQPMCCFSPLLLHLLYTYLLFLNPPKKKSLWLFPPATFAIGFSRPLSILLDFL